MTDRREEISDSALAEQLFAREREDEIAIHPAVGVRIKERIEARLGGKHTRSRAWIPALAVVMGAVLFFAISTPEEKPPVESLVRAQERPIEVEIAKGKQAALRQHAALIQSEQPEVLDGEVQFRVAKLPPGETFRVRAGSVVVEVIGTVFTVTRDRTDVAVSVEEGTVRVLHRGDQHLVHAGERWSTAIVQPALEPEHELEAPPESRTDRILEESYRQAMARPMPRKVKREAPQEQAEVLSQPVLQAEQRRSLLEQAAERLKQGDLAGARSIYRDLGRSEPLGLYLLARLEQQHAHRPQAALAALDEFLARVPDGELAAEARASRIEALLDLSQCDRAKEALAEFAVRHASASDLIARSKVRHQSDCAKTDERSPAPDH